MVYAKFDLGGRADPEVVGSWMDVEIRSVGKDRLELKARHGAFQYEAQFCNIGGERALVERLLRSSSTPHPHQGYRDASGDENANQVIGSIWRHMYAVLKRELPEGVFSSLGESMHAQKVYRADGISDRSAFVWEINDRGIEDMGVIFSDPPEVPENYREIGAIENEKVETAASA